MLNAVLLRVSVVWCAIAAVLASAGCKTTPSSSTAPGLRSSDAGTKLTQVQLRERLAQFYTSYVNAIAGSIERAGQKQEDVDTLRRLTLVKIRLVRTCRSAVFQENVMVAFLDTWVLCVQGRVFLESDRGEELGVIAAPLRDAAIRLEAEIEVIGRSFLPPDRFAELRAALESFARQNPFSTERAVAAPSEDIQRNLPGVTWVVNLPLAPFRAMEGVDQTADAVSQFAKVADGFSRTIGSMPLEISWELELLLLQLRRDAAALITDVDSKQGGLQTTLKDARTALAEADAIAARAEHIIGMTKQTLGEIVPAAGGLDQLLRTYTEMVKELHPPKPSDASAAAEREPKTPPFDIRDYARTIEGIPDAARELRGLIVELRTTLESHALEGELAQVQTAAATTLADAERSTRAVVDAALADAERSSRALLDAAVYRGIALIVAAVIAALIYRRVTLHWSHGNPIVPRGLGDPVGPRSAAK
jgi:hypothetical protein